MSGEAPALALPHQIAFCLNASLFKSLWVATRVPPGVRALKHAQGRPSSVLERSPRPQANGSSLRLRRQGSVNRANCEHDFSVRVTVQERLLTIK